MKVQQIYTGCLAQGAYYIESNGEAAIIDPLREVQPYLDMAEARNSKIKYIFETHFHADFVSGHVTLSEKTGAPIIYGPLADPSFKATIAEDGQIFKLGDVQIKAIHTPGHTMESTTYLLLDEQGKEHAIFSGDTLFLGDVGRPDLAQKATSITMEDLASILFDSLRNKLMVLPDETIVYPGHGAGSACGKNMSKETVGTLGEQKRINYALRADMSKEEFVKEVTDGILPPPAYFPLNVKMNKEGYEDIQKIIDKSNNALDPLAFEELANKTGALVLDVRNQQKFAQGHIPRSIFIGIDGGFAPWVGALIQDVEQEILLVVDEDRREETVTRLSRVGFDKVIGYLKGGIEAWKNADKEIDTVRSITAEKFASDISKKPSPIVDVRKEGEYDSAHLQEAFNAPLDELNDHLKSFSEVDEDVYIHCAGGYRSMIAASILKSRGIHNLIDVQGGFGEIKKTVLPVVESTCSSSV